MLDCVCAFARASCQDKRFERNDTRKNKMVIIEELYTALIEAGASTDTAKSAARAVAAYENQLADVRSDIKLL